MRKLFPMFFACFVLFTGHAFGQATFSLPNNIQNDDDLDADPVMGNFNQIINNLKPSGIGDTSENQAAYESETTPDTGSLPTDTEDEFQHLRGAVKEINQTSEWHIYPTASAETASNTASADEYALLCNATTAIVTQSLPTAVGIKDKRYLVIKTDSSVNSVVIDPDGSETINGATTASLSTQYQFIEVTSDNANWLITGTNFYQMPNVTLTDTPTISDFTNATHKHTSAAEGGIPLETIAAGAFEFSANNLARTTASTTYVEVKQTKVIVGGSFRVVFTGVVSTATANARVYRNGSPVGIERTVTTTAQTWSEDISGWTANDLVQVYAKDPGGGGTVTISNLRLGTSIPLIAGAELTK